MEKKSVNVVGPVELIFEGIKDVGKTMDEYSINKSSEIVDIFDN